MQTEDGKQMLVSVIMATRDRHALLRDALASVVAQQHAHWELLLVNDGGASVEEMARVADPLGRIRVINQRASFGPAAARNAALRQARGAIVCYLDDDDLYRPHHLSTVVRALADTGADLVYTDSERVIEELRAGERIVLGRDRPFSRPAYSRDELLVTNYIPLNAWAHRWELVQRAGVFDEQLPFLEDWELLLRFVRHGRVARVAEVTVEVRHRANRRDSRTGQGSGSAVETYQEIYRRTDDLCSAAVRAQREQCLEFLRRQSPGAAGSEAVFDHYAQRPTGAGPDGSGSLTAACQHRDAHYDKWLAKHSLEEIDGQLFAERMMLKWRSHPLLELVCVARRGEEHLLAATIDSIAPQMYKHWRLTIVAEFPPPDPLFEQHEQLRWIELADGQSPAAAVNSACQDLPDAWVALLRPGIRLAPQLLLSCADYINVRQHWRLIYTDSDAIDERGVRSAPSFRPDINVDLLRATPYLGEFLLVQAKTLAEIGGFSEIDGSEGYDLALRVIESCGESAIGHISDVLYHVPQRPSVPSSRVRERLVQHLARCGVVARVEPGFLPGAHRVVYQHTHTPLVSIVVPTRDKLEYLKPCIESLVAKTGYPRWELIVVDNQSSDPDALAYLEDLPRRFGERARVLRYPFAFNFSAICNLAARDARGEYLLFLNNDTEIVQPEWLERMMHHAQRPEVGIVGARLVYPETGKIEHAGVVLGMDGAAERPYVGLLGLEDPGYLGRALVDQNLSAVTGACLLVRKSVYEQVGGMDEHAFAVSYNDVDLCLKVGSQGHKIVWTPHATLVHHGSVSQNAASAESLMKKAIAAERFQKERAALLDKWLPWIASDPAYNRHLSLAHRDCRVETDIVINWDTTFHDRRRVLGIPLSGGSGEYRIIQPLRALSRAGHLQHDIVTAPLLHQTRLLSVAEVARAAPDVLAFHAAVSDGEQEALRQLRRHYQALYVFHLDDLITDVPEKSAARKRAYRDAKPRLRRALSMCDRLIVTTEPLAELCRGMIDDIRIIPNRLERAIWGALRSQRRRGLRARVGWAGAQQHQGDLALLREVVQATAAEVDWVFFGMCPEELRPYVREVHDFELGFSAYARKLASLDLDLAVAPLELNPFNEAKSNLRLLEYGILGWPVVCTDILPYQGAPVKRVPNQPQAWIEAIRERIHDLDAAAREGDQLRGWVLRNFVLEDRLEEWLDALGPSTADQTALQKTLKTA